MKPASLSEFEKVNGIDADKMYVLTVEKGIDKMVTICNASNEFVLDHLITLEEKFPDAFRVFLNNRIKAMMECPKKLQS